MRTLTMTGRVVSDAEKLSSKNGREYLSFRFANNEFGEKDSDGNPITYWFRVTSFQSNHFGLAQYLKKGKPLIITGRYSDNLYVNKNGKTEISRDILADVIEFIPGTEKQENNNAGSVNKETTYKGPQNGTPTEIPQVTNGGQTMSASATVTTPDGGSEQFDDDLPF